MCGQYEYVSGFVFMTPRGQWARGCLKDPHSMFGQPVLGEASSHAQQGVQQALVCLSCCCRPDDKPKLNPKSGRRKIHFQTDLLTKARFSDCFQVGNGWRASLLHPAGQLLGRMADLRHGRSRKAAGHAMKIVAAGKWWMGAPANSQVKKRMAEPFLAGYKTTGTERQRYTFIDWHDAGLAHICWFGLCLDKSWDVRIMDALLFCPKQATLRSTMGSHALFAPSLYQKKAWGVKDLRSFIGSTPWGLSFHLLATQPSASPDLELNF